MPTLTLENIGLSYVDGHSDLKVLDDVSLVVSEGQSIAIIGPSGCGKSSLLRIICGLQKPTSGRVCTDGTPIVSPQEDIGLILQDFGLLPWKNALENAALGLKVRGVPKRERLRLSSQALDRVELSEFKGAYPNELSGGMKQRLAIARALAMDAKILLMDEPLSSLDALLRERMQEMVLKLWQDGRYSQIIVTHSIDEAVFLGQRIVVMSPRPGRIVGEIDNADMGGSSYRSSDVFHRRVDEVREMLKFGVRAFAADASFRDTAIAGMRCAERAYTDSEESEDE